MKISAEADSRAGYAIASSSNVSVAARSLFMDSVPVQPGLRLALPSSSILFGHCIIGIDEEQPARRARLIRMDALRVSAVGSVGVPSVLNAALR